MFDSILRILVNYIFITVSIFLFFLPFYLIYRHRNKDKVLDKGAVSKKIEKFFLSKESNYLVFFWAMGEALWWFVIPEFLLVLIVFMRIKRKRQLLIYDVGGTIAGTVVAFMLHLSDKTIAGLPYIQDKMVTQVAEWYDQLGVFGLIHQPFSGVPYKVFTLMANRYDYFIIFFIIVAVIVRMSRYFIFFGLFNALYPGLHKFVYKNYLRLFFAAIFIFSLSLLKVVDSFS